MSGARFAPDPARVAGYRRRADNARSVWRGTTEGIAELREQRASLERTDKQFRQLNPNGPGLPPAQAAQLGQVRDDLARMNEDEAAAASEATYSGHVLASVMAATRGETV